MTLQLLWEEYQQSQPTGYRYSQFCELYRRWRQKLDVVLRQDYRAGEKMFVDRAGATIPIYDRESGEAKAASLFQGTSKLVVPDNPRTGVTLACRYEPDLSYVRSAILADERSLHFQLRRNSSPC